MKAVEALATFSFGVFIGAIAVYNLQPFHRPSSVRRISSHKAAFFLGITIKFNTIQDKENFTNIFRPYAQYVAIVEPGTISYELSESDKDPLQIFLVERYIDKNAYLDVHRGTDTFIAFRSKLAGLGATMTMDGHSYIESNIGFI